MRHLPILLVIIPLVGSALTPIVGLWRKKFCMPFVTVIILIATVISGVLLRNLYIQKHSIQYFLGGWRPPFGIEINFDRLATFVFALAILEFLVVIFSKEYVKKALEEQKVVSYYTLFLLNFAGMVGFIITGDLFNLFVFLEILSLSAYALVAIGGERTAEMASFKYLLVGAISSLCILMAIAFLYSITGTLNMHDMGVRLADTEALRVASVAFALFVIGFSVKAALFPLHIWLPDAHAIAPSPISAVLSGLIVKSGIFGIIRVLSIYTRGSSPLKLGITLDILSWLAVISIVMGAFFAIFQDDIKMMFAYSTISNIGYIVLGISLMEYYGFVGGAVHVFNHAIIKVALFLSGGAVIHQTGLRRLTELAGIGRRMPVTMAAMAIAAISIVGIPPTNGFICKWYIALGAVSAGKPYFAAALLIGALLIFIYYVRIINTAFFMKPTEKIAGIREAPLSMLIPVAALAVGCLVMGVFAYLPLIFIRPAAQELFGLSLPPIR